MIPQIHQLTFTGAMTSRGFWLYVCWVESPKGEKVYVGRTGDNSSAHAQSPFNRIGKSLSPSTVASSLWNHLQACGIDPNQCGQMRMVAYGPVYPEVEGQNQEEHNRRRDEMASLERRLCNEMRRAGYDVLNVVNQGGEPNRGMWEGARAKFAVHFPRLNNVE